MSLLSYLISMIRVLDLFLAFIGLIILSPLIIIIYFLLYKECRAPLFFQERIGKDMKKFILVKFRTMKPGTVNCATHLVDSSRITKLGKFLRKTKIDEIPQLINVLKGDMSIVGPRPCLASQDELIELRIKYNIHKVLPGLTGLAQIKGIDMSDPTVLANTEVKMIKNLNLKKYFYFIFKTMVGNGLEDRVRKRFLIK